MAETTYSYTISTDFPNGLINIGNLSDEIQNSAIVTALERIDKNVDAVDIVFKDSLSSGDRTILDNDATGPSGGLIATHDDTASPSPDQVAISNVAFTSTEHMKVEVAPREGTGTNFYTPNMCDKTSWFEGATAVTEFELTDSGDLTTWNTNGTHDGPWIDLTHGKIFKEDKLSTTTPALLCKVEVSTDTGTTWVEKTEDTFNDADEDYTVDYKNGTVTFNTALNSGDKVRASFSKPAATMNFTISPPSGKVLRLEHVETQISTDAGITCNVQYEVWAYNPYDLPNKICVSKSVYKTMNDFLVESTGVYPIFPKLDVNNPRGIKEDIIVVPFNYTASRDIKSSQGVEIRVTLPKEFSGTLCNTTFYCLEEDE
jgi:hypothetical protein